MGLFDNIRSAVAGVAGGAGQGFPRTLNEDDLMGTTSTALVAASWITIGSFTVPAQQRMRFGYGASNTDNQGFLYISLKTNVANGTAITGGRVRLVVSDANQINKVVVYEERTDVLAGSTTDRRLKVPLPAIGPIAKEDDRLQIQVYSDAAETPSYSASVILVPVTNYFAGLR